MTRAGRRTATGGPCVGVGRRGARAFEKYLSHGVAASIGAVAMAGSVQAQTVVTLYGIADASVRVDHTNVGTLKSLGSGGEDASRFGLRGDEALGDGWKAIFNFEQDFDLGDNSVPQGDVAPAAPSAPRASTGSRLFGRRAIVGLRSQTLGEIRAGRDTTPFYDAWRRADPWSAGTVSRASNYAVGNQPRLDNTITYESPKLAGLQATAQFSPGESTTADPSSGGRRIGDAVGASLAYAAGPIYAAAGYLQTRNAATLTRAATVAGTYDFGALKTHALAFYTNDLDSRRTASYALGVTVPIDAFKVIGVVARIDDRGPRRAAAGSRPSGSEDATFFGLGGTYAFSARTHVYLAVAKFVNRAGAAFDLSDNTNSGLYTQSNLPPGFNPWSAQFGVNHSF